MVYSNLIIELNCFFFQFYICQFLYCSFSSYKIYKQTKCVNILIFKWDSDDGIFVSGKIPFGEYEDWVGIPIIIETCYILAI